MGPGSSGDDVRVVKEVVLRAEARVDAIDAYRWYEENREGLGAEFRTALDGTLSRIARHPESYAPGYRSVRHALVRRFPYAVHFRLVADVVVVVAIMHTKRHPSVVKAR